MRAYNTLSESDKKAMLSKIGIEKVSGLFEDIPNNLILKESLNLPLPLSEWELSKKISKIAAPNGTVKNLSCFLGGGYYNHFIPAAVEAIVQRGEFLTSYTPYQPEMSQGLLQSLFEYQLMISKITGLPVVNSSCYDGSTALADAAWISCEIKKENANKLIISDSLWPNYKDVLATYMGGRKVECIYVTHNPITGQIDLKQLEKSFQLEKPSSFLFQSPNANGTLEDIKKITDLCKKHNVLSVASINPISLGLLESPGSLGVDIVTGEAQSLGGGLYAGGSSLGIFATKQEYRKYVPGRIVGKVADINGKLAYSLVFEEREQHIAREQATSNICSNQALNAIRANIYLSLLGDIGLTKVAKLNFLKTKYLSDKLTSLPGIKRLFTGHIFNEFVITLPISASKFLEKMKDKGILAGIQYLPEKLDCSLLINVTEIKSKSELDDFFILAKGIINNVDE